MKSRTIMFSAMLLFASIANAQVDTQNTSTAENDSVESYELSLSDAKDMAVDYNYTLKNASLAVQEAEAAKREAVALALPNIDATVDYTSNLGEERIITGIGNVLTPTSNANITATAFFNGTYIVGVQLAKMSIALNETTLEQTDLDIKQQVSEAYYSILLLERTKEILDQTLDNVNDTYHQTQMMYKAGVSELTDVDQLSIQVTLLESSLRTTNRQIEGAYDILRLQLGIDPQSPVVLTQSLIDFFDPESFYGSLLRVFNMDENVDYRIVKQQVEMSEKQVTLSKMEYVPTLSATYNYLEQLKAPDFNMAAPHTLMLNLSIPIFSSGERKAKVQQAQLQLEAAKNSRDQVSESLVIEDRRIKRELQTALDQYDAQEKNVEVAKRVYDNINRKYEAGMVSSLDLTTANSNYLDAESSYIQSMLDVLSAYVALENFYARL